MSAPQNRSTPIPDNETPASSPQIAPPSIGTGHPNFFPMQTVLEITSSLGEIKANMVHLTKSVDSLKTKVDDLVNWKSRILGGLIVVGFLFGFGTLLFTKFSSYITIKAPDVQATSSEPIPKIEPAKK